MDFNLEEIVDELIKLIETKKLKELKKYLETINSADFPSIFEEIDDHEKTIMIYRLLAKEKAAEVFVELDHDVQEELINRLTDAEIKNVMMSYGAKVSRMSGSGSSVFGFFDDCESLCKCRSFLMKKYQKCFVCETVTE